MKRAIKFWNQYASDKAGFSTSSTKYEVIPGLHPDSAGHNELKAIARELGIKTCGIADTGERQGKIKVTHAVKLCETVEKSDGHIFRPKTESHRVYLGFVELPQIESVPAVATIDNALPESKDYDSIFAELAGSSEGWKLGMEDIGFHGQDKTRIMVMAGWEYYHVLPLLGYSLDKAEKQAGIEDRFFYDSVTMCSACAEYDDNDSGYTSNFRHTDSGSFGINCGCFADYAESHIVDYANNASQAVELEIAEKLESQGRLKHIERFIGGMVDGRGGCYAGERVREGQPESVLAELLEKNPDGQYVFSHDESGQFQTYFSVWELKPAKKSKGKTSKRRNAEKSA